MIAGLLGEVLEMTLSMPDACQAAKVTAEEKGWPKSLIHFLKNELTVGMLNIIGNIVGMSSLAVILGIMLEPEAKNINK